MTHPTFINVGPGRCGTSWLHQALKSHPEISMSSIKETEYFNNNIDKGASWYESKFSSAQGTAIGEISNNYYLDPNLAGQIKTYDPQIQIVFNLREPSSLLRSMYAFGERRGLSFDGTPDDLDTAIGKVMGSGYDVRARQQALVGTDTPTLFEAALLSRYIPAYLEAFGRDAVHFFILERMKENPREELSLLYEFLGVDAHHLPDTTDEKVNDAIVANSRLAARTASSAAYALRKAGADRLLTTLHDSQAIKGLLFKKRDSAEVKLPVTEDHLKQLRIEGGLIAKLVPEVEAWWQL